MGLEPVATKLLEQLWTGDRGDASREQRPARCSVLREARGVGAHLYDDAVGEVASLPIRFFDFNQAMNIGFKTGALGIELA